MCALRSFWIEEYFPVMFAELDRDGDGALNLTEWRASELDGNYFVTFEKAILGDLAGRNRTEVHIVLRKPLSSGVGRHRDFREAPFGTQLHLPASRKPGCAAFAQ